MDLWWRLRGLLLSPRATWTAIAAQDSPPLARVIPLLLLPWALSLLLAAILGEPLLPAEQRTPLMMRRPDGTLVEIGVQVSGRAGSLVVCGLGMLATLGWLVVQRGMILRSAARHLAVPDPQAALKLTLHAPVSLWIALYLMPLGAIVLLPAMIHTVVLAYRGAPILLPPHPGQEKQFARSVAFGTALFGIATIAATMAASIWLAQTILG